MNIIRVFPRLTNATPMDENVRINIPPSFFDQADEVHISVTFTYDMKRSEFLYNQWKEVTLTKIGGPAFNRPGKNFEPGMYLKKGYVITSRGCPNRCWFCSVPGREGNIRELEIKEGYNVLDDNLLACSEGHIDKVFEMLKRQPKKPKFTGGLEARLMTFDIAKKLKDLKPDTMYFAYDTPDDLLHLIRAREMLTEAGFKSIEKYHNIRCFVLVGFKNDTKDKALERIRETVKAGYFPMAMLWQDRNGKYEKSWRQFQRQWANEIITACNIKKL